MTRKWRRVSDREYRQRKEGPKPERVLQRQRVENICIKNSAGNYKGPKR
jgi:hypothetical protein